MGAAAFVLALAPLGLWLAAHPSQYGDHVRMYSLYSPSLSPLQGVKDLVSYTSLTARADVYWDYFNPSFLFFAGDSSLINSTRHAGVFPFAFALLIPAGLWRFSAIAPDPTRAAIAVGFVLSPVAAVLVGESHRINRALVMLPFAALLATAGFEALRQSASRWSRLAAVAAVLAVVVQFTTFARDYFGDYRVRSSGWFERNIRGGIEAIISRDRVHPVPAVYLSNSVPWVDAYWRFYQLKHEGDDARSGALAERPAPTLFDPRTFDADGAPPGAVVLADAAAPPAHASALHEVGRVAEPNGSTSFVLLER